MALTKLENMIVPEVMADMISAKLDKAIRFAPFANVDKTLQGRPGDTITVPKWKYIGDAKDVAEGAEIDLDLLTSDSETFTIKKAGKGVEITDEAMLSGYGDPKGEAVNQLSLSISNKVDNDLLEALGQATLVYESKSTSLDVDTLDEAIGIFNDEDSEDMLLFGTPKDIAALRKSASDSWTRNTDLGDRLLVSGVFGELLGAQIVRTKKLPEGTAYLVKRGALSLFLKRDIFVETDRNITKKTTVATADKHYGVYLYDESKAIKITLATIPNAPQNLQLENASENEITISWSPVEEATSYDVYRSGKKITNTTETTHTSTGLNPDVKYTFAVVTVSDAGESEKSKNLVTRTTKSAG
ncbi:head protein [Bacillus pumilus]|nr:head protein [Bacillus pumilus]